MGMVSVMVFGGLSGFVLHEEAKIQADMRSTLGNAVSSDKPYSQLLQIFTEYRYKSCLKRV